MKRICILLALFAVAFTTACTQREASLAGCTRFTEIDAEHYRLEAGTLTESGFYPYQTIDFAYGQTSADRSEIRPVLGKTVCPKALWVVLAPQRHFRSSTESWTIGGVPYVVVDYAG